MSYLIAGLVVLILGLGGIGYHAVNQVAGFMENVRDFRPTLQWGVLLVTGVALLFTFWIARSFFGLEKELLAVNHDLEEGVEAQTAEIIAANEQLTRKNEDIGALNEELTAQNEEIQAMNAEIDSLNQNLVITNEKLEQRILERTADLTAANEELTAQYAELAETQDRLNHERIMTDAIFDIVPGALFLYDDQGNPVRWNRQIAAITGFSQAELSRMKLLDWFEGDAESYQRATRELSKVFRDGFAELEANLRTRDGARIPFKMSAVSLMIGERQYFAGIGMDITEQKRMTRELEEREVRLRTLVDTIPDMIWLKNAEGVYLSCNPTFERFFGAREAEIAGKTDYDFVNKELADSFREHDRKAMLAGRPSVNEEWIVFADGGDRVLVETIKTPMRDAAGELIGVLGVARDITVRKQMEEALADSEARYRAVMEQAPEPVAICDPDTGEILETNVRFCECFGYVLQRGAPLTLYNITVDSPENIKTFLEKIKQERYLPLQRRLIRHQNGSLIQVERSAMLVKYRDRQLMTLTIRDVSDEVRREKEIHRDAQLATRVQNALLTKIRQTPYLDIQTVYEPFSYVGGDLYFMDWRYHGQVLRGYIADATGHGLGTALHTSSMHVLLREVNEMDLPLAEQMRWLNRRAGQYFDEGTFAGVLAFEIDLQVRQLRWVCAGIPEIWLSTRQHRGVVAKPGMFLGISNVETFDMHATALESGDSCYFLTDGLADLLTHHQDAPLEDHSAMVAFLEELAKDTSCRDDATAICIQIRSLPATVMCQEGWPKVLYLNGYGDYQRMKGEIAAILAEVTGLPHSIQEVAVNEAIANALECRDGISRQNRAKIRFNRIGSRLIVRVQTSRMGFAGNALLKRLRAKPEELFSFGEDEGMGRGIPIMLSATDRMIYNDDGTELLLAWRL
jgi:PAS domain S-box-containing protein